MAKSHELLYTVGGNTDFSMSHLAISVDMLNVFKYIRMCTKSQCVCTSTLSLGMPLQQSDRCIESQKVSKNTYMHIFHDTHHTVPQNTINVHPEGTTEKNDNVPRGLLCILWTEQKEADLWASPRKYPLKEKARTVCTERLVGLT